MTELRNYSSQVLINYSHHHKTGLQTIFHTYYKKGHSPLSALVRHKCDLHSFYGPKFYTIVSDRAICPSYSWCLSEYKQLFKRAYSEPPQNQIFQMVAHQIKLYNNNNGEDCVYFQHSPLIMVICSRLMKNVFQSCFNDDFVTVRCFSGLKSTTKTKQNLLLFLCHSPIGSLPFGLIVTHSDLFAVITEAIEVMLKLLNCPSYSPKIIITDDNAIVAKCLQFRFPKTLLIYNQFHMLQSIWRIIRLICKENNEKFQLLHDLFEITLNSKSETEFKSYFKQLEGYSYIYPDLKEFLKYFFQKSPHYVSYMKPKVVVNVSNYPDSGTIILQDAAIKYCKAINIVQLLDFILNSYVTHYERRLNNLVDGELVGFFKTNFYVLESKLSQFDCQKISETETMVSNIANSKAFFVNSELDTCTCCIGVRGGSCIHQYKVETDLGLMPERYTPLSEDVLAIFKSLLMFVNPSTVKVSSPEVLSHSLETTKMQKLADQVTEIDSDDLEKLASTIYEPNPGCNKVRSQKKAPIKFASSSDESIIECIRPERKKRKTMRPRYYSSLQNSESFSNSEYSSDSSEIVNFEKRSFSIEVSENDFKKKIGMEPRKESYSSLLQLESESILSSSARAEVKRPNLESQKESGDILTETKTKKNGFSSILVNKDLSFLSDSNRFELISIDDEKEEEEYLFYEALDEIASNFAEEEIIDEIRSSEITPNKVSKNRLANDEINTINLRRSGKRAKAKNISEKKILMTNLSTLKNSTVYFIRNENEKKEKCSSFEAAEKFATNFSKANAKKSEKIDSAKSNSYDKMENMPGIGKNSEKASPVLTNAKGIVTASVLRRESGNNVKKSFSTCKPRSKSEKSLKIAAKLELIILLERNTKIEKMCQEELRVTSTRRVSKRQRKGYKELLERAQRAKFQ